MIYLDGRISRRKKDYIEILSSGVAGGKHNSLRPRSLQTLSLLLRNCIVHFSRYFEGPVWNCSRLPRARSVQGHHGSTVVWNTKIWEKNCADHVCTVDSSRKLLHYCLISILEGWVQSCFTFLHDVLHDWTHPSKFDMRQSWSNCRRADYICAEFVPENKILTHTFQIKPALN